MEGREGHRLRVERQYAAGPPGWPLKRPAAQAPRCNKQLSRTSGSAAAIDQQVRLAADERGPLCLPQIFERLTLPRGIGLWVVGISRRKLMRSPVVLSVAGLVVALAATQFGANRVSPNLQASSRSSDRMETAQAACHPSYIGACVPFARDVDCAGGSGNGPEYARGPIQVVGPDVYGLDRDSDGVACERG